MRLTLAALALLLCALFFGAGDANAQSLSTYELDRYYRGGAYNSFDGIPYTQRYNYRLDGGYLYLNQSANNLIMMDYYDRLDRAEKFGYRCPAPPFCEIPVAPPVVILPDGPPVASAPGGSAPVVSAPVGSAPEYVTPSYRVGLGFFRRR